MYLVTGGAGFLGSHLVKALIKNAPVRVLDTKFPAELNIDRVTSIQGNIKNYEVVDAALKSVDVIFHLASLLPPGGRGGYSMEEMHETNVFGTRNVLEAALKNNVRKVVYISSSSVYGIPTGETFSEDSSKNPLGEYGKSKLEGESFCGEYQSKGLDVTVLRPMSILGPRVSGIMLVLFDWIKNDRKIYTIGKGINRIQMVSVHDVVDACLLAAQIKSKCLEVFNIGSENIPTVREQIETVIKFANSSSKTVPLSPKFAKIALRSLRFIGFNVMDPEVYLMANQNHILQIDRAKNVLGWKPRFNNSEAMIEAYDWYAHSNTHPNPSIMLKLLYYFS